MKKNIAVIFGGRSTEYEVSCVSAAFIADNIDAEKYKVYKIGITKNGEWFLYGGGTGHMRSLDWQDKKELLNEAFISPDRARQGLAVYDKTTGTYRFERIDVIFPVLHGKNGEDGAVQGLAQLAGIRCVGCDVFSSALCMDKAAAKKLCETAGIPVVPYIVLKKGGSVEKAIENSEKEFGYPMFVKPARAGSSVGVTKAQTAEELAGGIKEAFRHDEKIMIEKNAGGQEIEVAVFQDKKIFASDCGEINPNNDFYDYDTKYKNDTAEYFIPARISAGLNEKISGLAAEIFEILDCRGLARVDFFACPDGSCYFNEINTIPGFTPISMFPRLLEYSGLPHREWISGLIENAGGE